jgi:hypothetical protein
VVGQRADDDGKTKVRLCAGENVNGAMKEGSSSRASGVVEPAEAVP